MPELGGLEVVRRLPLDRRPLVAFVTAFDEFAIEAFELNAIDYVLKPAERARVAATLERARDRLRHQGPWQAQATALAQAAAVYEQGARRRLPGAHSGASIVTRWSCCRYGRSPRSSPKASCCT